MFARIADRYDAMNRVMSLSMDRRWRRIALGMTDVDPVSVLDLACGTGDSTLEAARRFPSARVTGADLTPEMTALAEVKARGESRIGFAAADASDLGMFADGAFQLVFCAFGFRNFPDKSAVLRECRRVLDSGGELIVLELFRPRSRFLGSLVGAWITVCSSLFARGRSGEYAYLRRSMAETLDAASFVRLAEDNGFRAAGCKFLFPSATVLRLRAV